MNIEWQNFLVSKGAVFEDGRLLRFNGTNHNRPTDDIITCLAHTGLILAQGDDLQQFLQGQLSNDIRQVSEDKAQLSAYCSPKGRVLALFLIYRHNQNLYIQTNKELLEPTIKRLRMFIMRSKVTLSDCSHDFIRLAVSTAKGEPILSKLFKGNIPKDEYGTSHPSPNTAMIRLPGTTSRFELIISDVKEAIDIWTALDKNFTPVGYSQWELTNIEAGIPEIYPATVDKFVPQTINLDKLGAINFKKGCYVGQEVIARVKYLGRVKRHMYAATVESSLTPKAGDTLYSDDHETAIGLVVSAQQESNGRQSLLVSIKEDAAKGGIYLENEPEKVTITAQDQLMQ